VKPIYFHPEADAEVIEAARYYETRSSGLGLSFLAEVERCVSQITENPETCQLVGEGVRRKLFQRFPYSLLYADEPDRIRILAVAHHKRHPGYWQSRQGGRL